jgi:hypothetical protein
MIRRIAAVLAPVALSIIVTSAPAGAPPVTDDMRGFNPAAKLDTSQVTFADARTAVDPCGGRIRWNGRTFDCVAP